MFALGVADRVDGVVVERQQIVPALGDGQHDGQSLERFDRFGIDLEHPAEDCDQSGRVVGVPLLVELRCAQAELEHGVVVEVAADGLAIGFRYRIRCVEIACE